MTDVIRPLVEQFLRSVEAVIENLAHDRIRASLALAFGGRGNIPAVRVRAPGRRAGGAGRAPGRVSPVRRLQGRHLGALKGLQGRARARVKREARERGVAAAVQLASKLG